MVQFGQFFHAGYSMFKELKFGGQWFSLVNSDAMFWVSRSEFSLIPITTIHVMILGRALEWNVYSAGASVYDCLNLVFRRRNEKPWQKRWRWANRADERDWWIPWSLSQTNHPPNLPGFLMWPVGLEITGWGKVPKIHFLPDIGGILKMRLCRSFLTNLDILTDGRNVKLIKGKTWPYRRPKKVQQKLEHPKKWFTMNAFYSLHLWCSFQFSTWGDESFLLILFKWIEPTSTKTMSTSWLI